MLSKLDYWIKAFFDGQGSTKYALNLSCRSPWLNQFQECSSVVVYMGFKQRFGVSDAEEDIFIIT